MKYLALALITVMAVLALATPCYTFADLSNCPTDSCPGPFQYTGNCTVYFCDNAYHCQGPLPNVAFKRTRLKGYTGSPPVIKTCYGAIIPPDQTVGCCDCLGNRDFVVE